MTSPLDVLDELIVEAHPPSESPAWSALAAVRELVLAIEAHDEIGSGRYTVKAHKQYQASRDRLNRALAAYRVWKPTEGDAP